MDSLKSVLLLLEDEAEQLNNLANNSLWSISVDRRVEDEHCAEQRGWFGE